MTSLIVPTWFWWAGAVVLIFWTACQIQWELSKERDKNPASHPRIPMNEAARYIADRSVWIMGHQHDEKEWFIVLQNNVLDALRLGRITAFARDGAATGSGLTKAMRQVGPDEWATMRPEIFDGLFGNKTDNYACEFSGQSRTIVHDIHLSRPQVFAEWPPLNPIRRLRFKSLLALYERKLDAVAGKRA